MSSHECHCGRRRATAEEFARALEEHRKYDDDPEVRVYMRPLWITSVCFADVRGIQCRLKRRWASDRHILQARETFAAYLLRAGVIDEADWLDMTLRPDTN